MSDIRPPIMSGRSMFFAWLICFMGYLVMSFALFPAILADPGPYFPVVFGITLPMIFSLTDPLVIAWNLCILGLLIPIFRGLRIASLRSSQNDHEGQQ